MGWKRGDEGNEQTEVDPCDFLVDGSGGQDLVLLTVYVIQGRGYDFFFTSSYFFLWCWG